MTTNTIEKKAFRKIAIIGIIMSMFIGFMPMNVFAAESKMALTFTEPTANAPSSNIPVDKSKFYGAQGTAFDTYTHNDGYAISISKLPSLKGKLQVSHYKHSADGINIVKEVTYTKKQLGHANDATIFKYKGKKYMIVAKGGDGTKTATFIKLDEFNKGKAKTYKVKFKKLDSDSGTDLRGITYVGKKKVKVGKKKVKKDVFIVAVGRRMNLMYLKSFKKNVITLQTYDSQRIQAPKTGKREYTQQGLVYHNKNVYVAWGDEGKGGKNNSGAVSSISLKSLFKGSKPWKAKKFSKVSRQTHKGSVEFTPEAVYFTHLEGKQNLFMSCNVKLNKSEMPDCIKKSIQLF